MPSRLTSPPTPPIPIAVRDEGSVVTEAVEVLDFVGPGVSAATAAGVTTVTIPGGGGAGDITAHAADTTDVHGIVDTALLETQAGATTKVNAAVVDIQDQLAGHAADTTAVHGIADTSVLETASGAAAKVAAHEADTTAVHGIANTANLETVAGAAAQIATHTADTTAVHGIADTSALETTTGATAKVAAHAAVVATPSTLGHVRADNATIAVDGSGVLSVLGGTANIGVQQDGVSVTPAATVLNFTGAATVTGATSTKIIDLPLQMPFLVVAASDARQDVLDIADYVCDGVADDVEINAAIAALPTSPNGGAVFLTGQNFNLIASINCNKRYMWLLGDAGAIKPTTGSWTGGFTATSALVSIDADNVTVEKLRVQGSGTKGNGIGFLVGATDGRHAVSLRDCRASSCDTGFQFNSITGTGDNTGDCVAWKPNASNCKVGIKCKGFVNRIFDPYIQNCTVGLMGDVTAVDAQADVFGGTINESSGQAVWLKRGSGYTFHGTLWVENTDASFTATEFFKFGDTTTRVENVRFLGNVSAHINENAAAPESYVFRATNARSVDVDHLIISTSGAVPGVGVAYQDSTNPGTLRVKRVNFKTAQASTVPVGMMGMAYLTADTAANAGTLPVNDTATFPASGTFTLTGTTTGSPFFNTNTIAYTGKTSTSFTGCTGGTAGRTYAKFGASAWYQRLTASQAGATGQVIVEGAPAVAGQPAAAVVGDWQPSTHEYTFMPADKGAYVIKQRNGNVLAYSAECISPMNVAKGSTRTIALLPGTFDMADAWWKFDNYSWLRVIGSGRGVTRVQNLSNDDTDDTEPFDCLLLTDFYASDFDVYADGTADTNSSSDAMDFDQSLRVTLERIRVLKSRANGFVFDRKEAATKDGNITLIDCEATGCDDMGIKFLAVDHWAVIRGNCHDNGSAGLQANRDNTVGGSNFGKVLGGRYMTNTGAGVLIDESSDIEVTGADLMNNGTDGVRIRYNGSSSWNADRVRVHHNNIGDDQVSHTQDYGVRIDGGAAHLNDNEVTNNSLFGNTVAAILDNGTRTNDRRNTGWTSTLDDVVVALVIDGGGSAITTGVKTDYTFPWAGSIVGWEILADQSGSIVFDLWKDVAANYPPTIADTITASAKPTLTTATNARSTTLTGWTTAFAKGDTLRVNVDSATTVTRVTLNLTVRKAV